jgi:1,4-alpha-glucan branching enzyme
VRDLNRLYRTEPALHERDCEATGFQWVIGNDSSNSVFAYLRLSADRQVLVVCNMTPVPRHHYRIGVSRPGNWREILNTDSSFYGGSNVGNDGTVHTTSVGAHGQAQSLELLLPPFATLFLAPA